MSDLITISLMAVEDLVDLYEERVDLAGVEHAMVARAALTTLRDGAQIKHEQRNSAR